MTPISDALHARVDKIEEVTAMHDTILRGDGDRPGVLTLLDRTARSVERVEQSIKERDAMAVDLLKEARQHKGGVMLVALSALATAIISVGGWVFAYLTGNQP